MDDASLRVSDADRDRAVVALREHLLAGRLTLEKFSERIGSYRVRGLVGWIDVWRVPHDLHDGSSDRDIIHRLEGRRRQLPA